MDAKRHAAYCCLCGKCHNQPADEQLHRLLLTRYLKEKEKGDRWDYITTMLAERVTPTAVRYGSISPARFGSVGACFSWRAKFPQFEMYPSNNTPMFPSGGSCCKAEPMQLKIHLINISVASDRRFGGRCCVCY